MPVAASGARPCAATTAPAASGTAATSTAVTWAPGRRRACAQWVSTDGSGKVTRVRNPYKISTQ